MSDIFLHGLSTALPPHELPQSIVQERAKEILGPRYPQFDRLFKTFTTSGVETRRSVVPLEWFSDDHTWTDRNARYMVGGVELFIAAAEGALKDAGWLASDVDCIVTVSSTGIATPTLEAQASKRMGFRDDVMRVPLFGLGCAGGVSGLSVARTFSASQPGSRVLLVVVETCTLSFRTDRLQKADVIATVLFGDGAAGACLSSGAPAGRLVTLGRGVQKTWPDTLAIMGWDVDDTGLGVIFDRSIPEFVTEHFGSAATEALAAAGLRAEDVDRFVCHPGGAKVIDALEGALHLGQGSLQAERETLRRAGNMSAPTVLFVLQAVLEEGRTGQMVACALGPGFTAAFLPLKVAPEAVAMAAE